MAANANRYQIG